MAGSDDARARAALRARRWARLRFDVLGWVLLREAYCYLVAPEPNCHKCGCALGACQAERAQGKACCPECAHDNLRATHTLRAWLVRVPDDAVRDVTARLEASIARGEVR